MSIKLASMLAVTVELLLAIAGQGYVVTLGLSLVVYVVARDPGGVLDLVRTAFVRHDEISDREAADAIKKLKRTVPHRRAVSR